MGLRGNTTPLLIALGVCAVGFGGGCASGGGERVPSGLPAIAPALRFEQVRSIGSSGSGSGEFDEPMGIALDHRGYLYVVDMGNNRVQVFDPEGRFLFEFGIFGSENGQFIEPVGATADHGFSVAVTDARNERWQTFDLDGNFLAASLDGADARLGIPWGVARASDGRLYVSNIQDHSIVVVGLDGNVEFDFGGFGAGRGQLNLPSGVAFSRQQNLFVADTGNHRVQVFDLDGGPLARWGRRGAGPGEFLGPRGIAVDRQGRVYVADTGNDRIQVFDASGGWLAVYPPANSGGELARPADVAVIGARVFVADTGHDRVVELRVREIHR
ncbi:MAG: NHL repeat-containing protein [Candidatus Eisenbacteria sp.]|nr:NHL repeat-containing protein [Candidatus Eisenbacteria bacterium]